MTQFPIHQKPQLVKRLNQREMLELAARGVGRIDQQGRRGAVDVPIDQITAMAALLVNFGLVPVPPGTDMPESLLVWGAERVGPAS
ncbi:hypothetical protein [uncultured Tateyamaria sp.]|uniref:hypothetical protein n=1 Tax=uncultured Tateyamaria sp. TaxID=455651 RepID=UPI00260A8C70|nr:hypothetical protein [uncultured Tateyamaria sp.]